MSVGSQHQGENELTRASRLKDIMIVVALEKASEEFPSINQTNAKHDVYVSSKVSLISVTADKQL